MLNNNERDQWISYSKAVNEHSKVEVHPSQLNDKPENITHIEGYDLTRIKTDLKKKPIVLSFETFNIHLLYQKLTGKLIPALALSIGWIFCMAVLWFAYFKMFRKNYDLSRIFILGYMLYMVSEVFAPVSRNIYCAVQFFPIVLIYLSVCRSFYTRSALLIFSGLLLNITDLTFLPMRHSIGEVLIFCGFLIFVFKERDEQFFNA